MLGDMLEIAIEDLEQEIRRLEQEDEFGNRYEIERLGRILDSCYADLAEWDEGHGIGA